MIRGGWERGVTSVTPSKISLPPVSTGMGRSVGWSWSPLVEVIVRSMWPAPHPVSLVTSPCPVVMSDSVMSPDLCPASVHSVGLGVARVSAPVSLCCGGVLFVDVVT